MPPPHTMMFPQCIQDMLACPGQITDLLWMHAQYVIEVHPVNTGYSHFWGIATDKFPEHVMVWRAILAFSEGNHQVETDAWLSTF